ncbi:AmpG family muropeptide MFS transporter [Aurantivibrio plasticivorans]
MSASSHSVLHSFRYYLHPKVIVIFFLGASQGFPWVIISTALTIWLKEIGIDRSTIAFAGAILFSYSINFIWSPLVDRFDLGFFGKWLGNRRAWIVCMQAIIALGSVIASTFNPEIDLRGLVTVCVVIGIAAATQDIAIDAYRIESFEESETEYLAAGSSAITAGWWTGYAGIGFIPLWLSDFDAWNWPQLYLLMGFIMALLMIPPLLAPKRASKLHSEQDRLQQHYLAGLATQPAAYNYTILFAIASMVSLAVWSLLGSTGMPNSVRDWWGYTPSIIVIEIGLITFIMSRLWQLDIQTTSITPAPHQASGFLGVLAWSIVTVIQPLRDFLTRNTLKIGLSILLFVFLFKIGEAFLGRMSLQFYKEVGFTNTEIATWSKLATWWVTIIFALISGMVNIRFGIIKGLFISGIAMSATNLLYSVIANIGPNIPMYAFTIIVDSFAQAWSSVAFVAFISMLCDRTFTASQYALMASLGTLGRTLLASTSGLLVNALNGNWSLFFILTSIMVIPSLFLLRYLSTRLALPDKRTSL